MLFKNVASQKLAVYAHDTSADAPKTGDASNITAQISIDGGATAATNDTNPTELDATDAKGIYIFDLTQAETNGDLIILSAVSSTADVQIEPVIAYTDGVNVTRVSGSSDAADGLESQYDGVTGLDGDLYPATQAQIGNLANVGSAVNASASSFTLTTGNEDTNTYTATEALDQTYHELSDDSGTFDAYYEFSIGGDGVPVQCQITGHLKGGNDDTDIYAYDWSGSTWTKVGYWNGRNSDSDIVTTVDLLTKHVGTGANKGKVRIRLYQTGLTSMTMYVDQIFIKYSVVNRSVGYADGAIWVDTNNGTAGTESYVNGTADNPVDSWADALTLSGNLGLNRFRIAAGSSISLSANSDNYVIKGWEYSIDLNGQSISGAFIEGARTVTGTGTGTGARFFFCKLAIGGTLTIGPCGFMNCALGGDIVLSATGTYFFNKCFSAIDLPSIDFGAAVGDTNLHISHYSDHIELENMGQSGTDTAHVIGNADITINANCVGGTLHIIGCAEYTDNSGGAVTISDDSRFNVDNTIRSDVEKISGSADTANNLKDVYDDTTYSVANMKTFWENNSGLTTKTVDNVGSTAIRTGTAQAGAAGTITLDASASATDDTYNGSVCIITGGTGVGQCRAIVDYDGSTKVATITPNWTTSPDNTSTFEIQPASSILLHLLGMAAGKLAFSGNVVTVYDWDNSTTLFTNTWDTTGRTRS